MAWPSSEKVPVRERSETGFTLIETMVVLVIIAVLIAVGLPTMQGYRTRAHDVDAQADLRTTTLSESVQYLDKGAFTADTVTLSEAEPTVTYNVTSDPAGSVRVVVGTATIDVCMFSRSRSGSWWAVYHTAENGTRYGQSAPATCQASLASGWSTEGW